MAWQTGLKSEFRCKVHRAGALSNGMQMRFACFLSGFLTTVSGWAATTFGPGQIVYENGDPTPMIESIVSFAMGRGEGFDLPHAFLVTDGEALYSQEQTAVGVFDDPVMLSGSLSGENRLKVITGDLDGLHGDDVVLSAGFLRDVVEWYANKSTGGWEAASAIDAAGNVPLDAAIADLNGDGAKDLAVVMSGDFLCVWYEQDPVTHGFTKRALSGTTGADTFPEAVAVGDINGDTFPDIVTAARSPGEVFVYAGTSTPGSFATIASLLEHSPGVTNVRLHDVDGDDDLDLFVFEPFGVNSSLTLFKNDGSGNFSDPVIIFEGPASTWYTAYGDLDNDGDPDVVVMNGGTATRFRPDFLRWYENDGGGNYPSTGTTITLPSNLARSELRLHDADLDGDLDILTSFAAADDGGVVREPVANGHRSHCGMGAGL